MQRHDCDTSTKECVTCHAAQIDRRLILSHKKGVHPTGRELNREKKEGVMTAGHDQDTGNITGVLPLTVDMPMRLPGNVDRHRKRYRD